MEKLLTASELADRLQCSERTIWRMVKKGLPAHRVSDRLIRFDADTVEGWLKRRRCVNVHQQDVGIECQP